MPRGALLALGLLVTVVGLAGSASAGPLWPKKASEVVTLASGGACPSAPSGRAIDTLIKPDGTSEPFVIPDKRVLVVTGLQAAENGKGGPSRVTRSASRCFSAAGT